MNRLADRGRTGLGPLRKCCELISCTGPVFYHALSSDHVLWDGHSEEVLLMLTQYSSVMERIVATSI